MIRSGRDGWLFFAAISSLMVAAGLVAYTVYLQHQLDVAGDRYHRLQTDAESTERTLTHSLARAESERDLLQRKVAALTNELVDARADASQRDALGPCLPGENEPPWQNSPEPGSSGRDYGSATGGQAP